MGNQYLEVWLDSLPEEIKVSVALEEEMKVLKFECQDHVATVGAGETGNRKKRYATVYKIDGEDAEKTSYLLKSLKEYYESEGFDFGFSLAETTILKGILYKLGIKEREEYTGVHSLNEAR